MNNDEEIKDRLEKEFDFYIARKRYKEAMSVASQMVASFPTDDRGFYLTAYVHYYNDEEKLSLESINQAIGIAPDNSDYFVLKAKNLIVLEKNDDALIVLKEALRLDSQNIDAYCSLFRYYIHEENYSKAFESAKQAIEIEPSVKTMRLMVDYHLNKREYKKADEWMQKVMHEDPSNDYHLYIKGVIQLGLNQVKESINSFLNALQIYPLSITYKEALVESLRRKYPLFNWYQKLLNRLEKGKSMFIKILLFIILPVIIGFVIHLNFGTIEAGSLFLSLYFLAFIFLTILSQPITNLFLMNHPMASSILSVREKVLSVGLILQFIGLFILLIVVYSTQSKILYQLYFMIYSSIFFIGTIASDRYREVVNVGLLFTLIIGFVGYIWNDTHLIFTKLLGYYQFAFVVLFIVKFRRFLKGRKEFVIKYDNYL